MAGKFNLDDYVPVNERVTLFRKDHPKGRIVGTLLSVPGAKDVVVRADVYLGPEDVIAANGHAQETVGQGMVNTTSAMENCETSAWGRALANLGYEISRGIASREEMASVERRQSAPPPARQQSSEKPSGEKPTIRNPDEPCTEPQQKRLFAISRAGGLDMELLADYIHTTYGVERTKELSKGQISQLMDNVESGKVAADIAKEAFGAEEVPDGDTDSLPF